MPVLFPLAESWWLYLGFTAVVVGLLALDLGVLHHHRLKVVRGPVALPNVLQELADLVVRPSVAALICGDEEVT